MRDARPSHTTIKIARGMAFLRRTPPYAGLLPEGAGEATEALATAAGLLKPWMLDFYGSRLFGSLTRVSDRRVMPGQLLGSTLRKRFVNDQVVGAIERGATQVLIVGGGFDALGPRLAARYPEVTFVELDQPATMRLKRRAVETLGDVPKNLWLDPVDLARTALADALAGLPWRADAESVVVAEGVLMYLRREDVEAFLDAAHAVTGPGSTLVLTLIEARSASWLRAALSMVGETLRWGIAREDVAAFLSAHGFEVAPGSADLRARYLAGTELADAPLPELEHVVAAIRRSPDDGSDGGL